MGASARPVRGAQLVDDRVHRVRQDVLHLIDRGDRAPHHLEGEVALDVHQAADLRQVLPHAERRRLEQHLMPGAHLHAALGGAAENPRGLVRRRRERLLDVDVAAGVDRLERQLGVRGGRRHDVHHVRPRLREQFRRAGDDDRAVRQQRLQLLGTRRGVGHADHGGAARGGDGLEVMAAHLAGADEADAELRGVTGQREYSSRIGRGVRRQHVVAGRCDVAAVRLRERRRRRPPGSADDALQVAAPAAPRGPRSRSATGSRPARGG